MNQNATREEIEDAIREGLSNTAIARRLRCDRHRVGDIRRELGIPNLPAQPMSLRQKWAANTRPAAGGHVEWLGERQSTSGTPVLRYREKSYSPAGIAFEIRHGRPAVGYAFAECGMKHCIAPGHVDDETTRAQTREQLRYLTGGGVRKTHCVHGHDQTVHGRYESDGVAYCHACKLEQKRKTA